jgi:tetratricopeptide (TPR) repeat protein
MLRGLVADKAVDDGEWEVARSIYLQELEIAKAESDANVRASSTSRTLMEIAVLEFWQGNSRAAFDVASEAIETARTAEWEFILVHYLEPFAGIAVRTSHFEEAIRAADEGLQRLEDRRMNDLMRAMLFLRRGEANLGLNRHDELRRALDSAWKLIEPMSIMEDASGVQATFARWWRLESKLLLAKDDWSNACKSWETSLGYYRRVAESWDGTNRSRNAALAEALAEFSDAAERMGHHSLAARLRFERWQVCRANPGLA